MDHEIPYHLWTLIGTATYYQYSHDDAWLGSEWAGYLRAVGYILGQVGADGLLAVQGTADWARSGQGGENIEANALLYQALTTGSKLAAIEGNSSLAANYAGKAASLKTAVNAADSDGMTPLHWAVRTDDLETSLLLLHAGADAKATTRDGITPLWLAVMNRDAEMTNALLKAGADANAALPGGETILMTAARVGNRKLTEARQQHHHHADAREHQQERRRQRGEK